MQLNVAAVSGAVGDGSAARCRVGCLVEIRVGRLATLADVEAQGSEVRAAIARAGSRVVICADHRRGAPLSPQLADAWSRSMRSVNPFVRRSAILVDPENTTYNLQLERVIQCAQNPTRRLFYDRRALFAWVEDALTPAERTELRAFLG